MCLVCCVEPLRIALKGVKCLVCRELASNNESCCIMAKNGHGSKNQFCPKTDPDI